MKIGRISVKNFRSISHLELQLQADVNAFVGGNEGGKSNVLRAIFKMSADEIEKPFSSEDYYNHDNNVPEISITYVLEDKDEKAKEIIEDPKITEFTVTRQGDDVTCSLVDKDESGEEAKEGEEAASKPPSMLDLLSPHLPAIIYFPSFEDSEYLSGFDIPMEELEAPSDDSLKRRVRTIKDFLSIGNLSLVDLKIVSPRERLKKLIKGSSLIGQKLTKAWGQEDVRVRVEVADGKLVILVRDGKNIDHGDETSWVWTCPEHRSAGFQWFITFYSRFLARHESDKVVLLDDVGLYLHARAQRDLLDGLKELARKGSQILYTTHSPYFLDKEQPEKIYLVEKVHANGDIGTKLTNNWRGRKNFDLPEPLKDIGFTYLRQVFQRKNLIVEGLSDQTFLCDISKLFSDNGWVGIDLKNINIFPVHGAGNMVPYGLLARSENLEVAFLFDHDDQGLAQKQRAEGAQFTKVTTIREAIGGNNKTIEDLLPLDVYLGALNKVYKENYPGWVDIVVGDIKPTNPPRYEKIEKVVRQKLALPDDQQTPEFKDLIMRRLIDDGLTAEGLVDRKEDIEKLFTKINSLL